MTESERGPREAVRRQAVLAVVVLAHTDPVQVQRLVGALAPLPVLLHCDSNTASAVYEEMIADLPEHCTLLPRMRTGWARWENVAAEVAGYRMALERPEVTHVALLSGTDYPIASVAEIQAYLTQHPHTSFAEYHQLPYAEWGRSGGVSRLRYRHWVYGKRMLRLPIARRLPADMVFAGGSQMKLLARSHAAAVVQAADERPDLVRFFRRSWIADETFVGSVLNTPQLTPGWVGDHVDASVWWINWGDSRRKSPIWITMADLPSIEESRSGRGAGVPRLFARKFSTEIDVAVLDAVDERLRRGSLEPT